SKEAGVQARRFKDDDATPPITILKKKPKVMCLNELVRGNKEKGNAPSKKKALKDLTNKNSSNNKVIISRVKQEKVEKLKELPKFLLDAKRTTLPWITMMNEGRVQACPREVDGQLLTATIFSSSTAIPLPSSTAARALLMFMTSILPSSSVLFIESLPSS
ncbi:hypothetical protein GOP47_0030318, partial [Adiantum capillus-veneris]